jgi:hypothetical protein
MGRSSGRRVCLLFPGYPPEIFLGKLEQGLELPHPVIADVSGATGRTCLLQKPDGFLVVGLGYVKRVFESGLVLKGWVNVHGTSVVPIPG